MTVIDNPVRQRFEMEVDGLLVFCDYDMNDGVVALTHVEAPVALRGTGAAGRLMEGIMAIAEARGLKLLPICSYAVSWMNRHKAFDHLRA